jgi:hypothetical protein
MLSKNLNIRIYKTIILLVVLYGCETWSLTLRWEHIVRVLESKLLSKIFVLERDEVMGGQRKLHKEELHDLYSNKEIPWFLILEDPCLLVCKRMIPTERPGSNADCCG